MYIKGNEERVDRESRRDISKKNNVAQEETGAARSDDGNFARGSPIEWTKVPSRDPRRKKELIFYLLIAPLTLISNLLQISHTQTL